MSLNVFREVMHGNLTIIARRINRLIDRDQIIVVVMNGRRYIVRNPLYGLMHAIRQGIIAIYYSVYICNNNYTTDQLAQLLIASIGQFTKTNNCIPDNRRDINIIRDLYDEVLNYRPDDNEYLQTVFGKNADNLILEHIIYVAKVMETRHLKSDSDNSELQDLIKNENLDKLIELSNVMLHACGDKNPTLNRYVHLPRFGLLSNNPDELITALSMAINKFFN